MEITYHGGSSFFLNGTRAVAINSWQAGEAHISLHSERRLKVKQIVNGPGEYEIGDVLIVTVAPDRTSASLIHAITIDDITVLHMDGSSVTFTDRDLLAIGPIHVLLIGTADPKAAEALVTELSPRMTFPHGERAAELCELLGVTESQPQSRLSWNGKGASPRAVLLKPSAVRKRAAA